VARQRGRRLSPIRLARRAAFYKGLLGGNRSWMAVGAVLWVGRKGRNALGRTEEHVSLDKLRPGQGIEIRTIVPQTRCERRGERRSARRGGAAPA
jgi:hypothetical protein